jgi:Xaa-Pro aminopeptidase
MRSVPISYELFSLNRSKLISLLPVNAMAVVCSNPSMPRNGDQFYPYRQHSDFFYLTGIPQEGSVLVISSVREIIFIRRPNPKTILWSGPLYSREEASRLSGIADIRWTDEVDGYLDGEINKVSALYLNHMGSDGKMQEIPTPDTRLHDKLSGTYSDLKIAPVGPLIANLRMVKEPIEVEEIRKACSITSAGFHRILNMVKPGVKEYQVEAELIAEFIGQGAQGHAFEPIVAAGKNALVLHYVQNQSECIEGDLLLMDFGAEVNNYGADCSRTVPVSGRYTERQKEIYDAVHRVFIEARALMIPGTLIGDLHKQVGKIWEKEHISLGLYTQEEADFRPDDDPLWKQYYVHGTSHSLGLDVHDPMDRSEPFRPGMVPTCEPGIYIPKEGLGIRIENDILVTENGPVDLMEEIPIAAEEIEELMQKDIKR